MAHPGGPFWAKKDVHAWSIPKGEFTDETPEAAALREFQEETGVKLNGTLIPLQPVKSIRKIVYPFALEQDIDPETIKSNSFEIEWPPRSGKMQSFPEIDRCGWFGLEEAMLKLNAYQVPIVQELDGKIRT